MIDPLTLTTAISAASAAYGQVKKLVQAGREFEEISESLGKWMAMSSIPTSAILSSPTEDYPHMTLCHKIDINWRL